MMIDVSIATVYSGGILTILSFFSLFHFFPFVCKEKIIPYFLVLVLTKYVSKNKFIYFSMSSLSTV